MILSIETTPEQDAAIAAKNLLSNPDGQTDSKAFAHSLIAGIFDGFVAEGKAARVTATKEKLEAAADKLTDDQAARIAAILGE